MAQGFNGHCIRQKGLLQDPQDFGRGGLYCYCWQQAATAVYMCDPSHRSFHSATAQIAAVGMGLTMAKKGMH